MVTKKRTIEDLELIRTQLQEAMLVAGAPVKAQIAGQLRAVIMDLDGLAEPAVRSKADELAGKRAEREAGRADAADPSPAARRGQPRRGRGRDRAG